MYLIEKSRRMGSGQFDLLEFQNLVSKTRAERLRALREGGQFPELDVEEWTAEFLFKHFKLREAPDSESQYEQPDWDNQGFLHLLRHRTNSGSIQLTRGNLLSFMFGNIPEFHWPWQFGDQYMRSQFPMENENQRRTHAITSVLAATASGKTALSFRALCSNFGLYLTCTAWEERNDLEDFCDHQMAHLSYILNGLSQEELHLQGLSVFRMAMIARLSVLVQRTTIYHGIHKRLPSPKEFLSWQVNGKTATMESTFRALVDKSPAKWEDQEFLKKKVEDLHKQLIELLGVEWLPLFIDEANVLARPLAKDCVIITANGTIRSDGLLSLMLQSVTEGGPWSRAPIILTGTGFTTEVSNIIQSTGFLDDKEIPRSIYEFIGHPLVETVTDAITYLEKVITIPAELEECIRSPYFQSLFPMRRRLLIAFLRKWWDSYCRAESAPSKNSLLAQTKDAYKAAIDKQVKDLEKRANKCGSKMYRTLGVARFLSINQSDVDLFGDKSFLRVIMRGSPQLYHDFMATGFCSYHLKEKEKKSIIYTRQLEKGKLPSQGDIFFNLQEPAAQDTLNGLLGKVDHNESLGYLVQDIIDENFIVLNANDEQKIVSNHFNFELLTCFVIQSLFAKQGNPRNWSFIKRQAGPVDQLPDEGFFSKGTLGKIQGVIVGERSLISMLEGRAREEEKHFESVAEILDALQIRQLKEKSGNSKCSDEEREIDLLVLPKVDRIVALVLERKLHHLIEGYLIFPSEPLRPDAIGILKVSNDEKEPHKNYGLIISSTKRITTTSPSTQEERDTHNHFQTDRTRIYLSQKRVVDWEEKRKLIPTISYQTLKSKINTGRAGTTGDKWNRCFESDWNFLKVHG